MASKEILANMPKFGEVLSAVTQARKAAVGGPDWSGGMDQNPRLYYEEERFAALKMLESLGLGDSTLQYAKAGSEYAVAIGELIASEKGGSGADYAHRATQVHRDINTAVSQMITDKIGRQTGK